MSKNTIFKIFKSKKIYILALVALVGVLLVFFGSRKNESAQTVASSIEELDPSVYAESLEKRIEELCNRVDGVSGAYAVVTLKGGYRAIYAVDSQSGGNSSKNNTVVIGSGREEQAILEGYSYPEIAGIGIVCRGGDSYEIKNKIVSLLSSTFNLSANKIFVVGS